MQKEITTEKKEVDGPRKIDSDASKAIGQYLRLNSKLSTRTLANKLLEKGRNISRDSITAFGEVRLRK